MCSPNSPLLEHDPELKGLAAVWGQEFKDNRPVVVFPTSHSIFKGLASDTVPVLCPTSGAQTASKTSLDLENNPAAKDFQKHFLLNFGRFDKSRNDVNVQPYLEVNFALRSEQRGGGAYV